MHLGNNFLSGIEINQNVASDQVIPADDTISQDFNLPATYVRGAGTDSPRIPEITGFSIMVGIAEDTEDIVVTDWTLERYLIGTGWLVLADGTTIGAQAANDKVWFDVYFDHPVALELDAIESDFRITITGRVGGGRMNEVVEYVDGVVSLDNNSIEAPDLKTGPHLFTYDGLPSILTYDKLTGTTLFSVQQGFDGIWYGNLSEVTYATAYTGTGDITSVDDVRSPLAFRLLTASTDTGRDLFGNPFRHALKIHSIDNVTTVDSGKEDSYWMSKPNPSQFAIECQYFDISNDGVASVVDALLLDPITPDIYFTVYYSNEGDYGHNPDEWDSKLWTRVPKTFQARGRNTYVMPDPFTAKFAKIEYTHLQPRVYRPGPFNQPIKYRKHPKWVLDYFLLRLADLQSAQDRFTPGAVAVEYDALDLAYNYYLDDLKQAPEIPAQFVQSQAEELAVFYKTRSDASDQIDVGTLDRMNFATNPYREGRFSRMDSLLAELVGGSTVTATETGQDLFRNLSSDVSSLNRDAVIFEQSYPVMFYYLTCRHYYREVQAVPTHNRAYFAGIREIAWMRENYTKATDSNVYVEIGGDSVNLQTSDFIHDNNALVINDG